jgi:hypothetical protein
MSDVKPEFLSAEGYLIGVGAEAMTGGGITVFQRSSLERALWAYGEDELLGAVRNGLTKEQVRAIGIRHRALLCEPDPTRRDGSGHAHDKALAIAAVEVLEGRTRELARKRRRSADSLRQ